METNLFWMLLTFLLGLLVGNRMNLGRDRRKEFNELSKDTYRSLVDRVKGRRTDKVKVDSIILAHYFGPLRRRRFVKAVEKYDNAEDGSTYDPETGENTLKEEGTEYVVQCANNVAKFLSPR